MKFRLSRWKGMKLNLQKEITPVHKDLTQFCHSERAFLRVGLNTDFDGRIEDNGKLGKDVISETPSIIHENIKSE